VRVWGCCWVCGFLTQSHPPLFQFSSAKKIEHPKNAKLPPGFLDRNKKGDERMTDHISRRRDACVYYGDV
jgi:hypothetical protein